MLSERWRAKRPMKGLFVGSNAAGMRVALI
jgi:hypothetical protein